VRAGLDEDDIELGLLLGGSGGGGARSGGDNGGGGGNAPLLFKVLDEIGEFDDGLGGQPLDDLVFGDGAHILYLSKRASGFGNETRLRDVSPSLLLLMLDPGSRRRCRRRDSKRVITRSGGGLGLVLLDLGVEQANEGR